MKAAIHKVRTLIRGEGGQNIESASYISKSCVLWGRWSEIRHFSSAHFVNGPNTKFCYQKNKVRSVH